jgi:hypothetical protein
MNGFTQRMIAITTAATVGILLGMVLPVHAKCIPYGPLCQPGTGCEPMCITTSDGANEPYTDGRKRAARQRMYQHYRERGEAARMEKRREYIQHIRDRQEGRAQWRNDGTPSSVGTISPFVPGSRQDLAWKDERRRRGVGQ